MTSASSLNTLRRILSGAMNLLGQAEVHKPTLPSLTMALCLHYLAFSFQGLGPSTAGDDRGEERVENLCLVTIVSD